MAIQIVLMFLIIVFMFGTADMATDLIKQKTINGLPQIIIMGAVTVFLLISFICTL